MTDVARQSDKSEGVEVIKWLCTDIESEFLFLFGEVWKC